MGKWLSIIVPIYNASQYLSECLDSLVNQEFPLDKYEIILYDDGSQDSSLQIMRGYEAMYPNIRVFSHINVGVSRTRNCAIDVAEGEYIWFVDADDAISSNILPILNAILCKENLDILVLGYKSFDGNLQSAKMKQTVSPVTSVCCGVQFYMESNYATYTFNRLIRKELLDNYNIRFIPDIIAEDHELNIRCYYYAVRVSYLPMQIYYYRMRHDSLSHAKQNIHKLVESLLVILRERILFIRNHRLYHSFWNHVLVHDVRKLNYFISVSDIGKSERKRMFERERKLIREAQSMLSFQISLNAFYLRIISMSPRLLYNIQTMARRFKRAYLCL